MTKDEKEAAFTASAKGLLEEGLREMDSRVLTRLGEVRRKAIASDKKAPIPWMLPATGIAAACAVLLAFFIWVKVPQKGASFPAMEDLELLAAPESLEFYEDLAFYSWLETRDREG